MENGVRLDRVNKSDLVELMISSVRVLSLKEALQLSNNPNLFWFEFEFDSNDEYRNIFIEVQYKGNHYKATFLIAK